MEYPTMKEVEKADRTQLCRWYRFLPSPEREAQAVILKQIVRRFKEAGGMTPAISKEIGLQ